MTLEDFSRCSTTEPNTPIPESAFDCHFANLVPLNRCAKSALKATLANEPTDYHRQFIKDCDINGQPGHCFALSLTQLPEYPQLGWRIGKGRSKLHNYGVDFLLTMQDDEDDVAGIHARFHWRNGAGGFFVTADNKRGKVVLLNGEVLQQGDYRTIPRQNMIAIGECLFGLQFVDFGPEDEEQFQEELKEFLRNFYNDKHPFVLPTPKEHDVSFGEWQVQWAMSQGGFSTVYMVIHSRDGRPAAAKHLLKTGRNSQGFQMEIEMATRISQLSHVGHFPNY